MDSPKMQVKCGVETCRHNNNCMCYAEKLEVNATGDEEAHTSECTCCTTFIEK